MHPVEIGLLDLPNFSFLLQRTGFHQVNILRASVVKGSRISPQLVCDTLILSTPELNLDKI